MWLSSPQRVETNPKKNTNHPHSPPQTRAQGTETPSAPAPHKSPTIQTTSTPLPKPNPPGSLRPDPHTPHPPPPIPTNALSPLKTKPSLGENTNTPHENAPQHTVHPEVTCPYNTPAPHKRAFQRKEGRRLSHPSSNRHKHLTPPSASTPIEKGKAHTPKRT